MNKIFLIIGVVVVAILVASSSLFIVDQRQVAVIKTFEIGRASCRERV